MDPAMCHAVVLYWWPVHMGQTICCSSVIMFKMFTSGFLLQSGLHVIIIIKISTIYFQLQKCSFTKAMLSQSTLIIQDNAKSKKN